MAGDEDKPLNPPNAKSALGDGGDEEEDRLLRLPDDVLEGVLRRVPPRYLATSRCVCTAWRDAIDAHGVLRADLLPLSLAGLFVHFDEHKYPEFLARPSSAAGSRAVSGNLSFLPSSAPHAGTIWDDCVDWRDYNIEDHCNGLLLLRNNIVVNPATQRWRTLPTCPYHSQYDTGNMWYRECLVYDPMISPHYEVFMIPFLRPGDGVDPSMEGSEWPPSLCKMYVFSSKSCSWEEKCFRREGDAAGIVGEMRDIYYRRFNTVYYRGVLYVLCRADWILRISLSSNMYSVIKTPVDTRAHDSSHVEVVRSKKGVYFVAFDRRWPQYKCWLGVWILNESCGQMEWMLKHDKGLEHVLQAHQRYRGRLHWILEDINYNLFRSSSFPEDNKKATNEENFEWNSDDDVENEDTVKHCRLEDNKKTIVEKKLDWKSNNHNALNDDDMVEECYWDEEHYDDSYVEDIEILGFHPYKEIVFLSASESVYGWTLVPLHITSEKFVSCIALLGKSPHKIWTVFPPSFSISSGKSGSYVLELLVSLDCCFRGCTSPSQEQQQEMESLPVPSVQAIVPATSRAEVQPRYLRPAKAATGAGDGKAQIPIIDYWRLLLELDRRGEESARFHRACQNKLLTLLKMISTCRYTSSCAKIGFAAPLPRP